MSTSKSHSDAATVAKYKAQLDRLSELSEKYVETHLELQELMQQMRKDHIKDPRYPFAPIMTFLEGQDSIDGNTKSIIGFVGSVRAQKRPFVDNPEDFERFVNGTNQERAVFFERFFGFTAPRAAPSASSVKVSDLYEQQQQQQSQKKSTKELAFEELMKLPHMKRHYDQATPLVQMLMHETADQMLASEQRKQQQQK